MKRIAAWGLVLVAGCGDRATSPAGDAAMPSFDASLHDAPLAIDAAAGPDAFADALVLDAEVIDGGFDAATCAPATPSYTCTSDPGSCPGGTCITSWCLGPDRDPHRWDACGDGTCAPCEREAGCGIDCGGPARTGMPTYDPGTTITLQLHGVSVGATSTTDALTYGDVLPDRTLETTLRLFAPTLPGGIASPTAPNQLVAIEYYGTHAASWLSDSEIAEIEAHDAHGPSALERYALIVAIFLEHRLADAHATGVNILCHSMGCHITRYLVEHDLRQLASSGRIARVLTIAGALNGAGLAELFDNPMLQGYAAVAPIQTSDFTHLDPSYVEDESAIWDHHLSEANNPMWAGIEIHSATGTSPVAAFSVVRPLDVTNPDDEPNDTVLYARDTFFTAQDAAARFVTSGGEHVLPSHTWNDATHTSMESTLGAVASAAAAMLSHRRVTITLHDVTLHHDHEMPHGTIGTVFGSAPADLASNVSVTYAPFLETTFGAAVAGAIVSEQSVDARSAPFFQMSQDQTMDPAVVLFDAPVFDGQTQLHLVYELREVDHYPRFGIDELPSGEGSVLGAIDADVDLTDHTLVIDTLDVHASVDVHVTTMW